MRYAFLLFALLIPTFPKAAEPPQFDTYHDVKMTASMVALGYAVAEMFHQSPNWSEPVSPGTVLAAGVAFCELGAIAGNRIASRAAAMGWHQTAKVGRAIAGISSVVAFFPTRYLRNHYEISLLSSIALTASQHWDILHFGLDNLLNAGVAGA